MKERPIIMSGESVRAILAGRKTQTRRVVKPQPEADCPSPAALVWMFARETSKGPDWYSGTGPPDAPIRLHKDESWRCPYGKPGDRLWVKENCRTTGWDDHVSGDITATAHLIYRADDAERPTMMPLDYLEKWTAKVDEIEQIVGLLQEMGGPTTMKELSEASGLRLHATRSIVWWLYSRGRVRSVLAHIVEELNSGLTIIRRERWTL